MKLVRFGEKLQMICLLFKTPVSISEEIIRSLAISQALLQKYKKNETRSRNHAWRSPIALKTCSACSTRSKYYVTITVCPSNSSWAPREVHLMINPPKISENPLFSLETAVVTDSDYWWFPKDFADFHGFLEGWSSNGPISELLKRSWMGKRLLSQLCPSI